MHEPCVFSECSFTGVLAEGTRCKVKNQVKLRMKLLNFSWEQEFKILNGGVFPMILGLDFLSRTGMIVDVVKKEFSFGIAPDRKGNLVVGMMTMRRIPTSEG
jgi:hypothetical protein